ncbi:MAG: S41 family peptidase [Bacteroidetes bacterium]|nr:S41 family peptidase [Bacteroidota bacterium]
MKAIKKLKLFIISAAIALSAFLFTAFSDIEFFEISKNLEIFSNLFRELNIYYVDETKPGELMKTAIDKMLEQLDPYTNYIPESEMEDHRFMITGQYGGIGAIIKKKGEYVIIAEPYENSPAHKAGLIAGDILMEINGKNAVGKTPDDVSKVLKGEPGTSVRVVIKRESENKTIEKTIIREEIKIKPVPYYGLAGPKTGYIRLSHFTERCSQDVKNAFTELKDKHKITRLILDLRGNPGGLLNEAVNIVNQVTPKGQLIVETKGRIKDWDQTHRGVYPPVDADIPVVVIVDRGSASASEIVSGAIQDLDRGVIIGQRTYGKGLVQQTRQLGYNAQLKVTVAKYYVPSGRCIQAIDYSSRNEDGSVGRIHDSLLSPFKTKNGRTVYDGGGIIPDIITEPRKFSNIASALFSKQHIFDYATRFTASRKEIGPPEEFRVTEEIWNDFVAFINDKDYDYMTKSEKLLTDFKDAAASEKYLDSLSGELETLNKKIVHNKKEDIIKYKEEIKQLLREEIVLRYYFDRGRTQVALLADSTISRAVALLADPKYYSAILDGSVKKEIKETVPK